MRKRAHRLLLCLLLAATAVQAEPSQPRVRALYLSEDPSNDAAPIHVGPRVATVLRFEKDVDPSQTTLLGGDGWFEPVLSGGRSVLLVPRQNLSAQDRFLLRVMLQDGTELPFVITGRADGQVDQQVNVFHDDQSAEAMRARLSDARLREKRLMKENERFRLEETSVDHALAAILSQGKVEEMTPLRIFRTWHFPRPTGSVVVSNYLHPELNKAAVIVNITNETERTPWRLKEARLMVASTGKPWPFALRMNGRQIPPGASGTLAVVTDLSTFDFKQGTEKLILDFIRHDGQTEVSVVLEEALTQLK
jgi:uncharacterized protein (TIGR02268 family)